MNYRYTNGVVSIGDPVEVRSMEIKNMRGDYRVTWVPATVSEVEPVLQVTFADSTWMDLVDTRDYRVPRWRREQGRKFG